jgi:ribonuclease BN (tRNA processing enzyme)
MEKGRRTVKVTIIGCSGLFPGPSSAASCYLLESQSPSASPVRVLIDLGSGAFGPLQRFISPIEIDAILLTNLELDHCADLASLYVWLRYGPPNPVSVPLYGPPGTSKRLMEIVKPEGHPEVPMPFQVAEWTADSSIAMGGVTITPYQVNHPGESFGLRIVNGSSVMAYSGDTDVCSVLSSLADQADLLLADATFQEQRDQVRDQHMTGHRAGIVATSASVKRLVLTHLPVWADPEITMAEAASSYAGEIQVARSGQTYDVS